MKASSRTSVRTPAGWDSPVVTFTGTGTLHPTERAHTSLLLEDDPILFECGSGVLRNTVASDVDHESIDAVVLSHRHPDHVCGLVALILGTDDLTIYGHKEASAVHETIADAFDREVAVPDDLDTVSIPG